MDKTHKMTVKEIKDMISNMKDDDEVIFQMISGCCCEYENMVINDVSEYCAADRYDPNGCKVVTFDALPGYLSCLEVSDTKKRSKERWGN